MSNYITLLRKHGVNPSLLKCPVCGKDAGIALCGRLPKDEEAPREMVGDILCNECQSVVDKKGLLIIAVRDGEKGHNPYRTGQIVGVTEECKNKFFKNCNSSICYMEETQFKQMFNTAQNEFNSESENCKQD